jgi:hypothetical protein
MMIGNGMPMNHKRAPLPKPMSASSNNFDGSETRGSYDLFHRRQLRSFGEALRNIPNIRALGAIDEISSSAFGAIPCPYESWSAVPRPPPSL